MKRKKAYSDDERRDTAYLLLELIGPLLKKKDYSKGLPEVDQIERLYCVSKSCGMAAMADQALRCLDYRSEIFDRALEKALRKSILFDAEYHRIIQKLELAGVHYCPLKGMVIKHLYPMNGLREMNDIDIFVSGDREQIRSIMIALGYEVKLYNESNHDVYVKAPSFCVEIHHQMIDGEAFPSAIGYYRDYAEKLVADTNGSLALCQSKEDFYIYLIVHMYKHYILTGIGIRSIVDIAVYLSAYDDCLDISYIDRELEKLGISEFERQVKKISKRIFDPQSLTSQERFFLDDFVFCGSGGSKTRYFQNIVKNNLESSSRSSKRKYVVKRLRIPKKVYQQHPALLKYKFLIPPYAVYRLGKAILNKRHDVLKELNAVIEFRGNDKKGYDDAE